MQRTSCGNLEELDIIWQPQIKLGTNKQPLALQALGEYTQKTVVSIHKDTQAIWCTLAKIYTITAREPSIYLGVVYKLFGENNQLTL